MSDSGRAARGSRRVLVGLMRIYPAAFRDRFAAGMLEGMEEDLRAARCRGRLATARFWVGAVGDALVHGTLERIASTGLRDARSTVRTSPRTGEFALRGILQDLRFGGRSLARAWLGSTVSVLTLGVGIGATTAIFTVVDSVILEPLPYPDSDRLVSVYRISDRSERGNAAPLDVRDWREQVTAFEEVGAWVHITSVFEQADGVEQIPGARLSAGMLPVLGVPPAVGRVFSEEEDLIGAPDVILLSHRFWRDRLGADPGVLGTTIDRNGEPHTVVGVMPEGFGFPTPETDHWVPLRGDESLRLAGVEAPGRGLGFVHTVARLTPGTSLAAARTELQAVTAGIDEVDPSPDVTGATLISLHEAEIGEVRTTLLTFFAAVGIVLLISCANVASLALGRASARATEMSVRAALGAGRARLVQLVLIESAVLGLAAGAVGVVFALGITSVLRSVAGDTIPRGHTLGLDGSVLVFAGILALASGLAFGSFAAFSTSRPRIAEGLKAGARGATTGRGTGSLRNGLVIVQVGMALALMTGAGLLLNSYFRLTGVESGFAVENVLTARVTLSPDEYATDEAVLTFFDELTSRLGGLPGVTNVTTSYSPPLAHSDFNQTIETERVPETDRGDPLWAGTVIVGDGFFEAAGVPIRHGRGFDRTDRGEAPVAVVNETMAREIWPDEDPIGQRFRVTGGITGSIESLERRFFSRDWITVVGVAGDVRRESLEIPARPEFYRPHAQMAWPGMAVLVRTTARPQTLVPAIKREVRALDRSLAVTNVESLEQLVHESTAAPRFRTMLLVTFALIAAFLAMIGIYGVMAFAVGERRHEIGIRMALGASGRRVRREIVSRGLRLAGLGIALGLVGALAGARALRAMVFGISTRDPLTFALVALVVLLVSVAASYIPALKASRVDPTGALRRS